MTDGFREFADFRELQATPDRSTLDSGGEKTGSTRMKTLNTRLVAGISMVFALAGPTLALAQVSGGAAAVEIVPQARRWIAPQTNVARLSSVDVRVSIDGQMATTTLELAFGVSDHVGAWFKVLTLHAAIGASPPPSPFSPGGLLCSNTCGWTGWIAHWELFASDGFCDE